MATIAKENCFERLLAPAPIDESAMIAIAIYGRMSEVFVSNFHCIENATDGNIYHLTEHFSIVESSLRVTIFIRLIPRLFASYATNGCNSSRYYNVNKQAI